MAAEATSGGIRFVRYSQATRVELQFDFLARGGQVAMTRDGGAWTAFLPLDHPERYIFSYWYIEDGMSGPMETYVGDRSEGSWDWEAYAGRISFDQKLLSEERLGIVGRKVSYSWPATRQPAESLILSLDGISGPVVEAGMHLGRRLAAIGVGSLDGMERYREFVTDTARRDRLGAFVLGPVLWSALEHFCVDGPLPLYSFGRSNGGDFALWLALRYPERLAGAIVLSPLNALNVVDDDPQPVGPKRPAIYMSWGDLEGSASRMESAFNQLASLGYVVEGGPRPGGHTQALWCREVLRAIAWIHQS